MGNNGYINWLHLSDLHIGKEGNKWIDDTIRQELISYLDNIGTIDFILITGDMIDRGNLEDDNACKAAESLIKNLKQKVQKPIIFCIGNHDYIRTDERFDKLTLWESLDITEKEKKQTEYSQKLKEDFEKIVKLYKQWDPDGNCVCEGGYVATEVEGINIVVLNTSIFSGQPKMIDGKVQKNPKGFCKVDDDGKLWMDTDDFPSINEMNKNNITIVVGHHTLQMFEPHIQSKIVEFILSCKSNIYLCGHTHKNDADNISRVKQIVSAGTFKDNYNVPTITKYQICKARNEELHRWIYGFENGVWTQKDQEKINVREKQEEYFETASKNENVSEINGEDSEPNTMERNSIVMLIRKKILPICTVGFVVAVILVNAYCIKTLSSFSRSINTIEEKISDIQTTIEERIKKDKDLEAMYQSLDTEVASLREEIAKKEEEESTKNIKVYANNINVNMSAIEDSGTTKAALRDKIRGDEVIATDRNGNRTYTRSELENKYIFMPFEEGNYQTLFWGSFNENGNWNGECFWNTYKGGKLQIICHAIYSDGTVESYRQLFKDTERDNVWWLSERENNNGINCGSSTAYSVTKLYERNIDLDKVSYDDMIDCDDVLQKMEGRRISYYYGNSSGGWYNDDTGKAYLVEFNANGTVHHLYVGKFVNGKENDTKGWMISQNEDREYLLYEGEFIENKPTQDNSHWAKMTSVEQIRGFIKKKKMKFSCELLWDNFD